MKFTRYLLLFHFSRADRAVQIWMHFADNVDESKKCLPTWHMGFCKLGRETGGRRKKGGREKAQVTLSAWDVDAKRVGQVGEAELGTVKGMQRKVKIKHSSVVLCVRECTQAVPWVRSPRE